MRHEGVRVRTWCFSGEDVLHEGTREPQQAFKIHNRLDRANGDTHGERNVLEAVRLPNLIIVLRG